MSMRSVLIHLCKVVCHGLIITWFDKPGLIWYKFSGGYGLEVRNVFYSGDFFERFVMSFGNKV
jgi:hypothetical protein